MTGDSQSGEGAEQRDRGRGDQCRLVAGQGLCRAVEGAMGVEDDGDDRDAGGLPDLLEGVQDARRSDRAGPAERRSDLRPRAPGGPSRCRRRRARTVRRTAAYPACVCASWRIHRNPRRLEHKAWSGEGAGTDPVDQLAGDRGDQKRRHRPGQEPQTRAERSVRAGDLEVLAGHVRRGEDRCGHQELGERRGGEHPRAEQRQRHHRCRRDGLPGHEPDQEDDAEQQARPRPRWIASRRPERGARPRPAPPSRRRPRSCRSGRVGVRGP